MILHSAKKKVKSKPRQKPLVFLALACSPQIVKLPVISMKRNVFSMEAPRRKLELRPVSTKPKINAIKCNQEEIDQPYKVPFNRQRSIIPRYVPVYSREEKRLERPKVHVIPQWW